MPDDVRRELPWSWHRSPGWRGQLERIRRWHDRLLSATASEDAEDYLYAFFQNCYHLRYWLEPAAHEKAHLDSFFKDNLEMRLCRDLGNMTKHFELNRKPATGVEPAIAREYVGPGRGWFQDDSTLVIVSLGRRIDARDLASKCLNLWEKFLQTHDAT